MRFARQLIFAAMISGSLCPLILAAQGTYVDLTPNQELLLYGNVGNYYQFQVSDNLTKWSALSAPFRATAVPYPYGLSNGSKPREFYRALLLTSAENFTYSTLCAENDNVYVVLRGDEKDYRIKATHPTYTVTDYTLWDDFTDCGGGAAYENWSFTSRSQKMFDGGFTKDTVWVHRDATWWRPAGMDVTVDGNELTRESDMHRIVLVRYIPGSSGEWPEFLVLYSDGYLRLIPFPPTGHPYVSYGSSVIVGRIQETLSLDGSEARPFAAIESIDYRTLQKQLFIKYRSGGTATIDIENVTRSEAALKVTINHATDTPYCTLRSNYVSADKCDTSTVIWKDSDGHVHTNAISSFTGGTGSSWFFTRPSPSLTRNSSPDITISD